MDEGGPDFVYKFSEKTGNIGYGPEFRRFKRAGRFKKTAS
jgi:hypothetical protein